MSCINFNRIKPNKTTFIFIRVKWTLATVCPWNKTIYMLINCCAGWSDLLLQLMDPIIWQQRRAVELVACKISLLIEHWKEYLMVGGVVEVAGGGVGEDVEEEEATSSLMHETEYDDYLNLGNLFLYLKNTKRSHWCVKTYSLFRTSFVWYRMLMSFWIPCGLTTAIVVLWRLF